MLQITRLTDRNFKATKDVDVRYILIETDEGGSIWCVNIPTQEAYCEKTGYGLDKEVFANLKTMAIASAVTSEYVKFN